MGTSQIVFDWASKFDFTLIRELRTEASDLLASLKAQIEVWRQQFDPFIWFAGSLLALIPGTFAIYKWWYYRTSRLPIRLKELLEKEVLDVKQARSILLNAVRHPSAVRPTGEIPLFMTATLQRSLRNLSWGGWMNPIALQHADREMDSALAELEEQLAFCENCEQDCQRQRAAAYLIKGSLCAARAAKFQPDSDLANSENRNALDYFVRALEIDANDIEALQYCAHQHRLLGQAKSAIDRYDELIAKTITGDAEAKLARVRANRYKAEIFENQYDQTNVSSRLTVASSCLEQALEDVPVSHRDLMDEGAVYEVLARVKDKFGAVMLPERYYSRAASIYYAISKRNPQDQEARSGFDRVSRALKEFQSRSRIQLDTLDQ